MITDSSLSRPQGLLAAVGAFVLLFIFIPFAGASSILSVNYRRLVSRADLTYHKQVARSQEGLPVGNGTMGSLVWTTPSALKFQINRVDVYTNNCTTNSFNRRNCEFAFGCGYVDIDFVDFGPDAFPAQNTFQHLSVYDAMLTVKGNGITAQILAWHQQDVMAVNVTDKREHRTVIKANLRMLRHIAKSFPGQSVEYRLRRSSVYKTKNHTATSKLRIRNGRIVLLQEFSEGDYYCSSALAVSVSGRKSRAKLANVTEARLAAEPKAGSFTILIASSSSFDPNQDVIATALEKLDAAEAKGFDRLVESNKKWWHKFWEKAFVHLQSDDGAPISRNFSKLGPGPAELVEQHYTYFLYLMGSSSRGKLPPRYGGMIWSTGGDFHDWGSQHWWSNASCYYRAILPSNRVELIEPMFNMYSGMYQACATAARQQWGSKGIFIPETVFFDGLARLPDDIAEEMRQLYLFEEPWSQRSQRFREFAFSKQPRNGRWNWKNHGSWVDGRWLYSDKGQGPCGHTVHLFSATAKIAYQYWLRYEFTQDKKWLRLRAWPMIKGAAEFYRNYPNLKKGLDGKYHIYYVNNHESFRGYREDTMAEIAAMRGILPVAVRASEILGVDGGLRMAWQDLLDNLAPLPTVTDQQTGREQFAFFSPLYFYDLVTLETTDPKKVELSKATFFPDGIEPNSPVAVLSRTGPSAAILGRSEVVKVALPNQIRCLSPQTDFCYFEGTGRTGALSNRMTLREGVNSIGAQRLGLVAEALQLALCQSVPPGPGQGPVIHIFGAWPKQWNAEFTLLCRGGFLVTSSMRKGQIEFVEIKSLCGSRCRIRNPWPGKKVILYRNGKEWVNMEGSLLLFETSKDQFFVIVPEGTSPSQFKRFILGKPS